MEQNWSSDKEKINFKKVKWEITYSTEDTSLFKIVSNSSVVDKEQLNIDPPVQSESAFEHDGWDHERKKKADKINNMTT